MTEPKAAFPDGNDAIRDDLPAVVNLIVRTARWVDPETFRRLPVWYPEIARGQALYDARWKRGTTNTSRRTGVSVPKFEGNVLAQRALVRALGVSSRRPKNWTVCHIWGYDDESFAGPALIVKDPRYYSCVGNMIWLPTALKGFTDALPEIKRLLRVCAFHLYGWVCEHPCVANDADEIRSGAIPDGYPEEWPTFQRRMLPPGICRFSDAIERRIRQRIAKIRRDLADQDLPNYPRQQVRDVLQHWQTELHSS